MQLSIIIPAYNVENHIQRTLHSIISQTTKQFELIVVDDGSTDGTYNLVKEILREEQEINYKIITKENGGVSSARNKGLTEASGEYVMFLDADDYIADNLVEKVYYSLESQLIDVIFWRYNTIKEDKTLLKNYFNTKEYVSKSATGIEILIKILIDRKIWICTGSAAFRKELLKEYQLKYEEGCSNGEDQEFTFKVLSRAKSIFFIDEDLTYYLKREGSISSSNSIKRFDVIEALIRTSEYLNKISDIDFQTIAEIIKTHDIAENYFNNLESCMNNSNIRSLLNQINDQYPDLNQIMIKAMNTYNGKNSVIKIKCKLYLISPNLYAKLIVLKRKIKSIRKRG